MKKTALLLLSFLCINVLFSQAPQGINYQAVIRNSNGAAVTNTNLWLRVQLIQGSANGTIAYAEEFQVNSSTTGLVNIVIGSGTPIGAAMFSDIDWSNSPYFFEISYHTTNNPTYVSMGTQQFVSVPYSLYAETANSIANDQVNDADADPTNELQDLTLNGNDLSITNGSTVNLSSLQDGTGTDDQNLTLTGTNLQIENGNSVDLSILQGGTGTDDQNLTLTGTNLQIEDGNSVDLAILQDGTGTDDQTLTLTGNTLQIENGNSVSLSSINTDDQNLTLTGTNLQIENGNSVDLSSIQDGTGTDDQTLTLTGNTLQIENGNSVSLSSINTDNQDLLFNPSNYQLSITNGNIVDLSSLNDSKWSRDISTSSLYPSILSDNVGIGTTTPNAKLTVAGGNFVFRNLVNDFDAIKMYNSGAASTYSMYNEGNEAVRLGSNNGGSSGYIYLKNSNNNTTKVAIMSESASYFNGGNVGIGTNLPKNKLDVEGAVAIGATYSGTNFAPSNGLLVQGNVGIGTTNPQNKLDVEGGVVVGSSYSGTNTAPSNGLLVQGNVGIGTTNPQNKLDVNGDVGGLMIGYKNFNANDENISDDYEYISNDATGVEAYISFKAPSHGRVLITIDGRYGSGDGEVPAETISLRLMNSGVQIGSVQDALIAHNTYDEYQFHVEFTLSGLSPGTIYDLYPQIEGMTTTFDDYVKGPLYMKAMTLPSNYNN